MAHAGAPVRRQISLEFEQIEGISRYEVELARVGADGKVKKPVIFKIRDGIFSASIEPGAYVIRQRSFDDRGVPGSWSEPTPVEVKYPMVERKSPSPKQIIFTNDNEKSEVRFEWQEVPGAAEYRIEVRDSTDAPPITQNVKGTTANLELSVAQSYQWRVKVISPEPQGEDSEWQEPFTISGRKIASPEIAIAAENEELKAVKWSTPEKATSFTVTVSQKTRNDWQPIEKTTTHVPEIKPTPKWTKGRYRVEIVAAANLHQPSDPVVQEFDYSGFLTPKERAALAKKSAVKQSQRLPTDWYGIASYLVTVMNYKGTFRETDTRASFNAVGGTGRLGLGYQKHTSKWGTLGILDLSGFLLDNIRYQFASSEVLATYMPLDDNRLKISAGVYYKELPSSVGSRISSGGGLDKISYLGPTAQVLYQKPFTEKLGVAVLAQGYYGLLKAKTPNNSPIKPTPSYQAGVLGTLRLTPDILGYAGYIYRMDSVSWEATPFDPADPLASFANPGDLNLISIQGHYVNFILHVGF